MYLEKHFEELKWNLMLYRTREVYSKGSNLPPNKYT